jgi:hypothetical protein
MRTTITLDDGLAEDLRRRAAELGISVSGLIERTLREALARRPPSPKERPFRLITVNGKGLLPGVDLERAAKLTEADDLESLVRAGR